MASELEKQFFDTFGIEPKTNQVYGIQLDYHIDEYPQITDRILLELICIYLGYERMYMGIFKPSELRLHILYSLLDLYKETKDVNKKARLKHQVHTLFKDGQ